MVGAGADLAIGAGLVGGLAVVVKAPAVGRAGGGQGAGVAVAGVDLNIRAGLVGGPAVEAVAPAVGRAGGGQGAGVAGAGADPGIGAGFVRPLAVSAGLAPAVGRAGRRQGAAVVIADVDYLRRQAGRRAIEGGRRAGTQRQHKEQGRHNDRQEPLSPAVQ